MPLNMNIKCEDCVSFVDVTSICDEYKALVNGEEERNCYFYRAIPIMPKSEPVEEKPEPVPIKVTAPKKATKKKTRKRIKATA